MEDIGAKLYELIKDEFDKVTAADPFLRAVAERIAKGSATMEDVSLYAGQLGFRLKEAIRHNISAEALPNGRMYYNIAEKILSPTLHNNYDLVNDIASQVQEQLDQAAGIRIKPQQAAYPEDRVHTAINAAAAPDIDEETMIRRMSSPAENITASFADDYMQKNADFRSKAGFKSYIVRKDHSGCCEWCARQAGKYEYPGVPEDVFGRHDNCTCTLTYHTDGKRQQVWSKREWSDEQEQEYLKDLDEKEAEKRKALAERKKKSEKSKPKRLSKKEAAERQARVLDKSGESGIISIKEYHSGVNSFFENIKSFVESIVQGEGKEYDIVSDKFLDSLPKSNHLYSIMEALSLTNPTHNMYNCARCVPAYEMIRRGYDVFASFVSDDVKIEPLGLYGYKKVFKGSIWHKASGSGAEEIEAFLAEAGNGARVEISIRTSKFSHLFVAENDNGIVRFICPQSGKNDVKYYFDDAISGTTEYARIDNLPFSELIKQCVEVVK